MVEARRLQWGTLAERALCGLEDAQAARIVALLWLRSAWERRQAAVGGAPRILARNTEVARNKTYDNTIYY